MKINLTTTLGHDWENVHELSEADYLELVDLLTLTELPDSGELRFRAIQIANIANVMIHKLGLEHGRPQFREAIIGGFAGLMKPLHEELEKLKIIPLYPFEAFVEVEESKGTAVRHARYQHVGFVGESEQKRLALITPAGMYTGTSWIDIWSKLPAHTYGWTLAEFRRIVADSTRANKNIIDLTAKATEPLGMSVSRKTNGLSDWDSQW